MIALYFSCHGLDKCLFFMVKLLSTKFELLSSLKGKFIACHRFECLNIENLL